MPDYSSKYFTIRSLAANNTITFTKRSAVTTTYATSISYSTDNGATWNTTNIGSGQQTVSVSGVNNGDEVLWKGIATAWAASGSSGIIDMSSTFSASGNFEVEGNIMSLLHGDDFQDKVVLTGENNFSNLFGSSTTIKGALNLVLPATTLTPRCYGWMFQSCSNIISTPAVMPAKVLTYQCYKSYRAECWNATSVPIISATTQDYESCNNMFLRNSAITETPIIRTKALAQRCFAAMFHSCTAITKITCLVESGINQNDSTTNWVYSIPTGSTKTFYKSPNASVSSSSTGSGSTWPRGANGIPSGWTVVNYNPFFVDVDTITAPASGSAYTINLTSSNQWTATTEQSWLTVSPSSGTGDTALTVTISANNLFGRSGTIELTDSDSNSITITVYQAKASVSLKSCSLVRSGNVVNRMYREGQLILLNVAHKPHINLSEDEIDFEQEASSTTITVESNMVWTASTSTPWITITTGASALNVAVSENTTGEDRDGTITITGRNILGTVSTSITVNQFYVIDYTTRYLTTRSLADNNTITFRKGSLVPPESATYVAYSTDNGTNWTTMYITNQGEQTLSVVLNSGETAIWKGEVTAGWTCGSTNSTYYSNFLGSGDFEVEGNLMSMVWGDDFSGKTTMPRAACRDMFRDSTNLVSARNFKLTATSFGGNGTYGYEHMFSGCSKLEQGPDLDAFSTLLTGIYKNFFYNCTSLKYIKCTATNTGAIECTVNWVYGVPSGGTFVKAASKSWSTGTSGIPSGWTVVEVD